MTAQRHDSITDVPGILVGHTTRPGDGTGCTVVLCQPAFVAGIDVSGGAPGTRETTLLDPACHVQVVHAILLTGGSAFGLAAADGVMRWLAEHDTGIATPQRPVPLVPAAAIYDLNIGDPLAAPDADDGYQAAMNASSEPVAEGRAGAGTGALAGKVRGPQFAMPGGLGSASVELPGGLLVGALAVANPFGDVRDPASGQIVAGAKDDDGGFLDTERFLLEGNHPYAGIAQNTTLGVIATNARLDKAQATRVARMAANGLARTCVPCASPFDGDVVFVLASGDVEADVTTIGTSAAQVLSRAIIRAVTPDD